MKNTKKLSALLLCSLLALAGCSSSTSTSTTDGGTATTPEPVATVGDDSLEIVLTTAPVGFHPLKTNDSASTFVNGQVYETLYLRTMDGTGYEPLLAKDLPDCNEDGTVCTIALQEGVKFQDGSDFTAEDVKYTLESIKDPDYGSARASISASIDEVEVVDDYTVALHLAYPDGVLTAKLAHTNSAIVPSELDTTTDLNATPVGTGPYKFVSAVSGAEVTLTRNDDYWGTAPEIKDVHYTVITDESTAISRLETGEADFLPVVSATAVDRVNAIATCTTTTQGSSAITYLGFRNNSSANPKMADLDLRKAIVEAIDMDAYIESVLGGLGSHSQSILGPTVFGYTDQQETYGYAYNPEDAKKLVEEGGYANEEIKFLINNRATTVALAEYIQASLQAVGLTNVKIEQQEWASFLSATKEDNAFDMTILTWSNVTGDGTECLDPNFTTENGSGRIRYENADFDTLVDSSKKTIDSATRIDYLDSAAELIEADAVAAPLYNMYSIYTVSNGYTNVQLDKGGLFYISQFQIAK